MRGKARSTNVALWLATTCLLPAVPAYAQSTANDTSNPPPKANQLSDAETQEIIVTARKRAETLTEVPVAIAAISAAEITRGGINSVDALSRKVPGFVVGEGGGTVQGGSISLRGISAADSNPLGDQAVSFNVDGVQVARASVRRMGSFDLAGLEVLKGPQALFYGKNSPGGIVSMKTADPSDHLEVGAQAGYEFRAKEVRGEGYISGPLADGLGGRLALYGSTMKGWVQNLVPSTDLRAPNSPTSPNAEEWAVRGTLKFDKGTPFRAKLKVSYGRETDNGISANYQTVDCPTGTPAAGGSVADCKADERIVQGSLGPALGQITTPSGNPGVAYSDFGNGALQSATRQLLAGLEANYDLTPRLTLTSVSGLYKLNFFGVANYTATNRPDAILGAGSRLNITEASQELRLASSFTGPVNLLLGGQYQYTKAQSGSIAAFGTVPGAPSVLGPTRLSPFIASNYYLEQEGWAYSFFAQMQFKPIEQIELSAGGRYSHEHKELTDAINRGMQLINSAPFLSNGGNARSFDNFSPEISASYRPTRNLNVYGNYKQGFLSGGFNGGSINPAGDFSYRPQKVRGFEAGVKARMADGKLTADLALYSYKITDLQVQVTTNGATQELRNAGKVSSRGVEFGLTGHPTAHLMLYGNIAYAVGKYDQYYATCYAGQAFLSPGTGIGQCAMQPNPTNNNVVGLLQNLSGTELLRDPKWSGNAGFVETVPLGENHKLELSGGLTYSDSYVASATSQPRSRSPSYTMFDATVRFMKADDRWEVALIGKNLTNEFYWVRATDNSVSAADPTRLADTVAVVNRGREIMLRLGFKY